MREVAGSWWVSNVHRRKHAFDFLRVGQATKPLASQRDVRLFGRMFLSGCVKPVFTD